MGNLLLTFPELAPGDFLPYVDAGEAARKGLAPEAAAEQTAATWAKGLASWGQDGARIARLKAAADFAIYTPGSRAGLPLSILSSLDAPPPGMDEIFGYFPPTANPPSKAPMLTLLKQARAFGLGVVLSTQNPVDLDYRGLSNTGTWFIGRLQTERDKMRVIEGLTSAAAGEGLDRGTLDRRMANLGSRVFLMRRRFRRRPMPTCRRRWPTPNAMPGWRRTPRAGCLSSLPWNCWCCLPTSCGGIPGSWKAISGSGPASCCAKSEKRPSMRCSGSGPTWKPKPGRKPPASPRSTIRRTGPSRKRACGPGRRTRT